MVTSEFLVPGGCTVMQCRGDAVAAAGQQQQQQQQQAAATASKQQQQQARASAAASSEQQQRAASSSSSEQQRAAASSNSSSEHNRIHRIHVDLAYISLHNSTVSRRTPRISRISNQSRARQSTINFILHSRIRHHRTQRHHYLPQGDCGTTPP